MATRRERGNGFGNRFGIKGNIDFGTGFNDNGVFIICNIFLLS